MIKKLMHLSSQILKWTVCMKENLKIRARQLKQELTYRIIIIDGHHFKEKWDHYTASIKL